YEALLRDYQAWEKKVGQEVENVVTDEGRRQVIEKVGQQPQIFAQRFLELAEKHPQDPAAIDALCWIIGIPGPESEKAVAILTRAHLGHKNMTDFFARLTGREYAPVIRTLLR